VYRKEKVTYGKDKIRSGAFKSQSFNVYWIKVPERVKRGGEGEWAKKKTL